MRGTIALSSLVMMALVGQARAADFRLFRIEGDQATVVDFDAVGVPANGLRTISFYGAWQKPVHAAPGDGLFLQMAYRYNCSKPSVRADSFVIYDRTFQTLAHEPGPSPWRPIQNESHLQQDFQRFCSANPRAGDIGERLPAADWRQAVVLARQKLRWTVP